MEKEQPNSIGYRKLTPANFAKQGLRGLDMIGTAIDNTLGLPGQATAKVLGAEDAVPKGFSEQVGQAVGQGTGNRTLGAVAGFGAAIASPDPMGEAKAIKKVGRKAFEGFQDLSTKVLERNMKDRISVSPQYVKDALRSADVKESERNIIEGVLKEYDSKNIPVAEFAEKVKTQLLPLTVKTKTAGGSKIVNYEDVNLPKEQRGVNYGVKIYESPVANSAGESHFRGKSDNYFAHVRLDESPDGKTRRILEAQSDLFQKGQLENEITNVPVTRGDGVFQNDMDRFVLMAEDGLSPESAASSIYGVSLSKADIPNLKKSLAQNPSLAERIEKRHKNGVERLYKAIRQNAKEKEEGIKKLQPYRNTFWQRIIREEVKQAANKGQNIQVPTGKTAMKIQGLDEGDKAVTFLNDEGLALTPDNIKKGMVVSDAEGVERSGFVVNEILGDGRFVAVRQDDLAQMKEELAEMYDTNVWDVSDEAAMEAMEEYGGEGFQTLDISKNTPSHPIYKYYEKDMGKYLKKKYGAELAEDEFGNTWWQFKPPKEARTLPVEAFGAIGAVGAGGMMAAQSTPQTSEDTIQ